MNQQIKIFKSLESNHDQLEQDVNKWLSESNVKVLQILGNIAPQTPSPSMASRPAIESCYPPSDLMLVVLYEPRVG